MSYTPGQQAQNQQLQGQQVQTPQTQNNHPPQILLAPIDPHPNPDPLYDKSSPEAPWRRDIAWKYFGYAGLSRWMASSNDFFLLRKFSSLSARSLAYLSNEIAQREKKIAAWDDYHMRFPYDPNDRNVHNGCFRSDAEQHDTAMRAQLLVEVIPLLQQYYNLVNSYTPIKARATASEEQRSNLQNWFITHENAIDTRETHFLDVESQGDLFPIISKPKTPLGSILEKVRLFRLPFRVSKVMGYRTDARTTSYYSTTAFEFFTSIVVVILGLVFLFAPMWWLNFVQEDVYRLSIITGAVSIFAFWMWMAAGHQRSFEILAGTAAYAAVLMVFLQVQKD